MPVVVPNARPVAAWLGAPLPLVDSAVAAWSQARLEMRGASVHYRSILPLTSVYHLPYSRHPAMANIQPNLASSNAAAQDLSASRVQNLLENGFPNQEALKAK